MNKQIKNVVFDFDGVLSDMDKKQIIKNFKIQDYYNSMRLGIAFLTNSGFRKKFLNLYDNLKRGDSHYIDIRELIDKYYPNKGKTFILGYNNLLNSIENRPLMMKFSDYLRENGIKTYILSNTIPDTANLIYLPEVYSHFNGIYCSSDTGFLKPSLDIFEDACEIWNIKPEESIFIDNNRKNVKAAKIAGFKDSFKATKEQKIKKHVFEIIEDESWSIQK